MKIRPMTSLLTEVSRKNLVGKTKVGSPERYNRRLRYGAMSTPEIDGDKLLDEDMLVIYVQVGKYTDTIAFAGVLKHFIEIVKRDPKHAVNRRNLVRAINEQVDLTDVFVNCSCPDFKCFTADTKIKLLSGESLSIKEIAERTSKGEQLWVYSTDEKGDFRPGEIEYAGVTGTASKLARITLDNKNTIECTPDHLFMLREGTYKAAKDLIEGQSLMPLYFKYNNGYEAVKRNSIPYPTAYESVYKLVAKYCLSEEIEQAKLRISEHHKKLAATLTKEERRSLCEAMISAPWTDERRIEAANRRKEWWDKLKANPDKYRSYVEKQRVSQTSKHHSVETRKKIGAAGIRQYQKKLAMLPENERKFLLERKRINSIKISDYFPGSQVTLISRTKATLFYLLKNGYEISEDNYNKYKNNKSTKVENLPITFEQLKEFFGLVNYNHKVVKVEIIDLEVPVDVYDLSVKDYHNFLLDAGVVVHNCRYAYWATRYDYKYGTPETRPAKITNPDDSIGAVCKHLASILSNKKWLVKAASVVNDFIQDHYDEIVDKYKINTDEFILNMEQALAASAGAIKRQLKALPPNLAFITTKLWDPNNLDLDLFDFLDNKGWVIRVDEDLNKPVRVFISQDPKSLDDPENAKQPVYIFDVEPAGTKIRLVRYINDN